MSEVKFTEENKKTITAFVTGLIVGGLLVYIFALPAENANISNSNDIDEVESMDDVDMEEDDTSSDTDEDDTSNTDSVTETSADDNSVSETISITGEGVVEVSDQSAGLVVGLDEIIYPTNEGWIGVRDFENGQMTGLLGVSRWSKSEGLLPEEVKLLRATQAGRTYAVVFYSDNGDREFRLATDSQMVGVMETFEVN